MEAVPTEPGNTSQAPADNKSRKGETWLPCHFRVGDPEHYAKITEHCPATTYKGLSKTNEHGWRYHSWDTRCTKCWATFRESNRKSIDEHKAQHASSCEPRELTKEEEETIITFIKSKELQDKWDDWRTSLKEKPKSETSRDPVPVRNWKHIFGILFPGKEVPDPLLVSAGWPRAARQPSGSQPPGPSPHKPDPPKESIRKKEPQEEQPRHQPARKRQASSSPAGKRTELRESPFDAKEQTTEGGPESFGLELAGYPQYIAAPPVDGCVDPAHLLLSETCTATTSTASDSESVFSSQTPKLGGSKTALHPDSTMPTTTGTSALDRLDVAPRSTDLDDLLTTSPAADTTEAEECLVFETILGPNGAEAPVDDSGLGYRKTIDENDLDNSSE